MAIMALCGVSVPRSVFPAPVRRLTGLLPVTHGLDAIRGVIGSAPAATVLGDLGLEVLVGVGWLALSLLTFKRLAEVGRRNGSIVFSSV